MNLAVLLGSRSGGICAIDFDDEAKGLEWESANPELAGSLKSTGSRGWQVWFQIAGDIPPSEKTADCEWRADGNLSTIAGIHPTGCEYRLINEVAPLRIHFSAINWPVGWVKPGIHRLEQQSVKALEEKYGEAFFKNPKGDPNQINEPFWAGAYRCEVETVHCPEDGTFWRYEEESGLWIDDPVPLVRSRLSDMLLRQSRAMNVPWLARQRSQRTLQALSAQVANVTARVGAFDQPDTLRPVIHTANCVLAWRGDRWEVEPFSPDFWSRNASPIPYVAGAECPRFLNDLVGRALGDDDVRTLQTLVGMFLLGRNVLQRILILDGEAGTGKSQIQEVIRGIVGVHNCCNLRTDLLHERFEIANYIGKTVLLGSDVSADFLSNRGAPTLKALVGGDQLMAEVKGSPAPRTIFGRFNVLITANAKLRLRLQDDVEAWRRRLVILTTEAAPPEKAVPDFGNLLLREEGPGILNWALRGVEMLFEDMEQNNGRLLMTDAQKDRVSKALAESDSLRIFVKDFIRWDAEEDLTTEEILAAYGQWCSDQEIAPLPERVSTTILPTLMLEHHSSAKSGSIVRNSRERKGFRKVTLKDPSQPSQPLI